MAGFANVILYTGLITLGPIPAGAFQVTVFDTAALNGLGMTSTGNAVMALVLAVMISPAAVVIVKLSMPFASGLTSPEYDCKSAEIGSVVPLMRTVALLILGPAASSPERITFAEYSSPLPDAEICVDTVAPTPTAAAPVAGADDPPPPPQADNNIARNAIAVSLKFSLIKQIMTYPD
jgi:hypothetical protein